MNTAARAAVRLGISRGYTMLGIRDGFPGLREGRVAELSWGDVEAWTADGGAKLGLRRTIPTIEELYPISRQLEDHHVDALLMIGGWNGYQAVHLLHAERDRYPAFRMPMVCLPASIDNNLPGSELAVGADTALNVIVEAIDRIKLSASATKRSYIVETMGRYCGYLTLMGGLAGGSERVYLHEEGITLERLNDDVKWVRSSFAAGRSLFLAVRNERANEYYTTDVIARLLQAEAAGLYDVRQGVLGHQQQGGSPSPFDRLMATRLARHALEDRRSVRRRFGRQLPGRPGRRQDQRRADRDHDDADGSHVSASAAAVVAAAARGRPGRGGGAVAGLDTLDQRVASRPVIDASR